MNSQDILVICGLEPLAHTAAPGMQEPSKLSCAQALLCLAVPASFHCLNSTESSRHALQVVIVSATLPHEVLEMTHKFMNDPVRVLVKRDELTLEVGMGGDGPL